MQFLSLTLQLIMRLEWLHIELIDIETVLSSWKSLVSYYITVSHEPRPDTLLLSVLCTPYTQPSLCLYIISCRSSCASKNSSDPSSLHAPSTSISLGHPWHCQMSFLGTNHCIPGTAHKVCCLALTQSSSHHNLSLVALIRMLAHFTCFQHINVKKSTVYS